MKFSIVLFGLLMFVAFTNARKRYPNFKQGNLAPIHFPANDKTKTTKPKPAATQTVYVPGYVVPVVPAWIYPFNG